MKIENDTTQDALEAIQKAESFILIASYKNQEGRLITKNTNVNLVINAAYQILKHVVALAEK